MKRIERYVFRQALGAFALVLLSLTAVVWIAVALRQLNLMTSQGQDALVFLKMTLLAVPNLIGLIAPIALLVACIFVLNRLSADSELIVLTAAGAPVWRIVRPLLLLAVFVSVGVSVVNHFAMPWSLRALRGFITEVRTDLISQVIQPGRFSSPEADLTFHIRDRTLQGELLGLLMHDGRDPKQAVSYLAERGMILNQDDQPFLIMEKGHILRRTTDAQEPVQIVAFDRYVVDLSQFEQKETQAATWRARERYFHELVHLTAEERKVRNLPGQVRAELHERFSSALYPFAFLMIVIAFCGQAQTTRTGRGQNVAFGFLAAASLRIVGLSVTNLAVISPRAVPVLYALPIGATVLATVQTWRNMRPKPQGRFSRLTGRGLEATKAMFSRKPERLAQSRPSRGVA